MIERKIIIGLITSTEYCRKIKDFWNPRFLESATAKQLAMWVWEYYDKYKKAPGKDIEAIFYTKLKETKLAKGLAEEIEQDILPGLSDEFSEEEFNLPYLLEESEKYFNIQHLNLYTNSIQALVKEGKTEDAEKLAKDFKSLGTLSGNLNNHIATVDKIREKKVPKPMMLMKPWLFEGQTTILYGPAGVGKSLITINVAYNLGLHDYDDSKVDIGPWQVRNPTGTLYVDGELGEQEMDDRIKQFEWIGRQSLKHKIQIFSVPEYQLATEDSFYLSTRPNQLKIINWLKENPTYKLVILDSASTLFGLIEENDNSEWSNKINPFLRDLRALGVACLLLHHSGKDGKKGLRGASAMSAMAHNIFRLTNHGDKDPDGGEAYFTLNKDKQRASGFAFKNFAIKYTQSDNKKETHWEITNF